MPYRRISLTSENGHAEPFWVRVPQAAVAEWLGERARLRLAGYPDRPPDVDTPTLRVWLPRPAEQGLPYFSQGRLEAGDTLAMTFGVYTASWHDRSGAACKVIVTGLTNGSTLSRVLVVDPSGACPVDTARLYEPEVDSRRVGDEIETIVAFINARPGWAPDDPSVTTYEDFLAVDVELVSAKAEAMAAGLVAPERVH